MTTDAPWDSRWRSESHYQGYYHDQVQAPRPPAPAIGNQTSQSLHSSVNSYSRPWDGQSRGESEHHARSAPSMIDLYSDASTYHSRLHQRHASPGRNSSLTNSPSRQKLTDAWHSLPVDHHAQNRNISDAPLSLHRTQTQDLPRLSTSYLPNSALAVDSKGAYPQQTTSLPSFASLSEQANRTDDPDEVEIAPMSARLSCYSCDKLTPMVREVALAVAELDENVQHHCNKSVTRTLDFPNDNPVRAVQWILDRLAKTKADLQDTARRTQSSYYYAQAPTSFPGMSSRNVSPPGGVKRPADRWDQDELPAPKRPRSGASFDDLHRTISNNGRRDDRRGSIDFPARSPPPTESIPGSAYPRTGSPGLSTRPHRTLPSPSSLAFAPSAAPSLAAPTAQSIGSPTTSYQPAVSIHTASASSATSAHIADLQHQVTLKSLALQTLQSEYASLLQKLNRERVKSQTIEKKTSVADQEVNELTGKNEDLIEQVKTLETELAECVKKRKCERATTASEKAQWMQMLGLNRRLQSRDAEENQKLRAEKDLLTQRVAAYEGEDLSRFDHIKRSITSRTNATRLDSDKQMQTNGEDLTPAATAGGSSGDATNDAESLNNEIVVLNNRIDILRFSLEEAKRRNQHLGDKAREVIERNAEISIVIDRTLEDDAGGRKTTSIRPQQQSDISRRSTPVRQKPTWSPTIIPAATLNSSGTLSKSPNASEWADSFSEATSASTTMASIARAISPGPAELGFHVTPSTSSPEELISALGPVPAPPAAWQFGSAHTSIGSGKRGSGGQRRKPRKQSQLVFSDGSHEIDNRQFDAFHSSPQIGMERLIGYPDTPSQSFHSSPSSVMGSASPTSSGSESRRSSEEEKHASPVFMSGQSTFLAGLPSSDVAMNISATSTMPPPPRPYMNLKDLCSQPTGPIAKP